MLKQVTALLGAALTVVACGSKPNTNTSSNPWNQVVSQCLQANPGQTSNCNSAVQQLQSAGVQAADVINGTTTPQEQATLNDITSSLSLTVF